MPDHDSQPDDAPARYADLRPMLSVADVAIIVSMSEYTIREAIRDGQLIASKLRGRIRIDPQDVHRWISASTIIPAPAAAPAGRPPALVPPQTITAATPENIDALIARARRQSKAA